MTVCESSSVLWLCKCASVDMCALWHSVVVACTGKKKQGVANHHSVVRFIGRLMQHHNATYNNNGEKR